MEGKHIPLHLSRSKGEKAPKTADAENLANTDGLRDGPVAPAQHPPERHCQGVQKQQLHLRGHLNPSVSYCLATGSQWIISKLNIQIKTKSANQRSVLPASSTVSKGRPRRQGLPRPGVQSLRLARAADLTWKPVHVLEGTGNTEGMLCWATRHDGVSPTALPRGTRLPTPEAVTGAGRCQLATETLFKKKYQVKCKL